MDCIGRSTARLSAIAAQPVPGTEDEAREAECKVRMADIAGRYGVPLVDFRLRSPLTSADANYWDSLHYRLPIADRVIAELKQAVATARDDPGGDWRYLAGPPLGQAGSLKLTSNL